MTKLLMFTLLFSTALYSQQDLEFLDELGGDDIEGLEEIDDLGMDESPGDLESSEDDSQWADQALDAPDNQAEDQLKALESDLVPAANKQQKISEKPPRDDVEIIDFMDEMTQEQSAGELKAKSPQEKSKKRTAEKVVNKGISIDQFDVGVEEKELLEIAKNIGHKLSPTEWSEVAKTTAQTTYTVVEDDTLWKISKTLFGTGFFYSKIWSLNPYIANPHQIEPGMVLTFSSGSEEHPPEIKFGSFSIDEQSPEDTEQATDKQDKKLTFNQILSKLAEDSQPPWLEERKYLIKQGFFVQSASTFTYQDLLNTGNMHLLDEYKTYTPPASSLVIALSEDPEELGFDKSSIIRKDIKTGFYVNTFLSTNIVQDFGHIEAGPKSSTILGNYDITYVQFDAQLNISPGDKFSVYVAEGVVEHRASERKGHRYTIKGHLLVNKKQEHLWECEVFGVSDIITRNDRITAFTPKLSLTQATFNQRNVEAVIISAFDKGRQLLSYGDIVYIDRGRADGIELGNVFEAYSSIDQATGNKITRDPTYKIGELSVINLTENFATTLISNSRREMALGQLLITKTLEQVMKEKKLKRDQQLKEIKRTEKEAMEELDVELNLDDVGTKLRDEADQITLNDDELEELERQEREKSLIKEHENDNRQLNQLEQEIEGAEALLNEAIEDQNQELEDKNLDTIEQTLQRPKPDAFESLDEIEDDVGKKYLDEDLNAQENPYGLTEFDLEEIDELLNTTPQERGQKAPQEEKLP